MKISSVSLIFGKTYKGFVNMSRSPRQEGRKHGRGKPFEEIMTKMSKIGEGYKLSE